MGGIRRSAAVRAVLLTLLAAAAVAVGAGAAVLGRAAAAPGAPGGPGAAPPGTVAATARPAARPVAAGPCGANRFAKLIEVDISRQRAWFCDHHRAVRSIAVTTGAVARAGRATPTGWFHIEGRARETTLRPAEGGRYHVRYWVPFSGTEYGFHDASWQRFPLGSSAYRRQGSHGCVHLSLSAMRFLYTWGSTGTAVHITR